MFEYNLSDDSSFGLKSDLSTISSIGTYTVSSVPSTISTLSFSSMNPILFSRKQKLLHSDLFDDFDSGMNTSSYTQQQALDYLYYRVLDYWIHEPELKSVLKFMKIDNDKVVLVSSMNEYDKNDVKEDTRKTREKKSDYIEENILPKYEMRRLLGRVIEKTKYKWVYLSQKREEQYVVDYVVDFLKDEFKDKMKKS